MSDSLDQFPEFAKSVPTKNDAETKKEQRSASSGKQPATPRPSTAQNAMPFPENGPQGICTVSTPTTPKLDASRPELFNQAPYPVSSTKKESLPAKKEAIPKYSVSRDLDLPKFQIVDIDKKFAASVLERYIARGSSGGRKQSEHSE